MSDNQYHDANGRPLIAVTGVGIVTSLGQGKETNWARLMAGESGIHNIGRFPTNALNTKIGGTVEFLSSEANDTETVTRALAFAAADEALAECGFPADDFGGPLFLAAPPVELEWPQRKPSQMPRPQCRCLSTIAAAGATSCSWLTAS